MISLLRFGSLLSILYFLVDSHGSLELIVFFSFLKN